MNKVLANALLAQYCLSAMSEIDSKKSEPQSEESKQYYLKKAEEKRLRKMRKVGR